DAHGGSIGSRPAGAPVTRTGRRPRSSAAAAPRAHTLRLPARAAILRGEGASARRGRRPRGAGPTMRYRRLGTRYALILSAGQPAPLEDPWPVGRLPVTLAQPRWRPPADVYETARDVTVVVAVAGLDQ